MILAKIASKLSIWYLHVYQLYHTKCGAIQSLNHHCQKEKSKIKKKCGKPGIPYDFFNSFFIHLLSAG